MGSLALKWIAVLSMLTDHGAAVFSSGRMQFLLRNIPGRLAFPLFAFMLAEGFFHTRNPMRYLLRVLGLAALSEIPYALALQTDFTVHNTCFTFALALLLFRIYKEAERCSVHMRFLVWAGAFLSAALLAVYLHLDYGFSGIAALSLFYIGSGIRSGTITPPPSFADPAWICSLLACLALFVDGMPFSLLALFPIRKYDPLAGSRLPAAKYFFYAFYPLHLLFLFLLHASLQL